MVLLVFSGSGRGCQRTFQFVDRRSNGHFGLRGLCVHDIGGPSVLGCGPHQEKNRTDVGRLAFYVKPNRINAWTGMPEQFSSFFFSVGREFRTYRETLGSNYDLLWGGIHRAQFRLKVPGWLRAFCRRLVKN